MWATFREAGRDQRTHHFRRAPAEITVGETLAIRVIRAQRGREGGREREISVFLHMEREESSVCKYEGDQKHCGLLSYFTIVPLVGQAGSLFRPAKVVDDRGKWIDQRWKFAEW